jgi:hypothetical protein
MRRIASLCAVLLVACTASSSEQGSSDQPDEATVATSSAKADSATTAKMKLGGGAVLWQGINVYVIWYGNWATGPGHSRPVIEDFLANLDDPTAGYWNILSSYYDAEGHFVLPFVNYAGSVDDAYSRGKTYGDYHQIVRDHLEAGDLPQDPFGVYLVLPDMDVNDTGLCGRNCGSHGYYQAPDGERVHVAHVVHTGRCPKVCGVSSLKGITGNPGADWMPTIIAHELAETVTDPEYDGWKDTQGKEMADKCVWKGWGSTYLTENGAEANTHLGTRDYLLQPLWLLQGEGAGQCATYLAFD